jgi:hypothetical protein
MLIKPRNFRLVAVQPIKYVWYGFGTQDGFSIGLQNGLQIITLLRVPA